MKVSLQMKFKYVACEVMESEHWECDCIQLPSAQMSEAPRAGATSGRVGRPRQEGGHPTIVSIATLRLLGVSLIV